MAFVFDLSDYDAVRTHAYEILDRVREGTMPCDDPWPPERVARLDAWIDAGMPR